MEAIFNSLKNDGKNNVENLVKWLKDSNMIGADQADKVLSFFANIPDPNNISLETFKDIIMKIATEFSLDLGGLSNKLGESGPKDNTDEAVEGNTEEAVEGNTDEDDDHPKA